MIEALARIDLLSELSRFGLVLLRASGLVTFCPIFSSQLLPGRMRVAIAVTLAFVLMPLAPELSPAISGLGPWTLLAVRELSVGFGLGLAARVVFDGIEGATGNQSVAPALFQALLVTTLVLASDLHHLFLRGLARSYEILPPAAVLPATEGLADSGAVLGARLFAVAVELAAPALVITFAADLVLVLVGRAMPQMPVLLVGYPLKLVAGLLAMLILAYATGTAIRWIGRTFAADGAALLQTFASN
jgi:flagellar biosynthetic protein FliR